MIETLKIQNFKVLREVDLKFRPLTVIVGPNGSGKSTVLQALSLVADLLRIDFRSEGKQFLSGERAPEVLRSRAAGQLPTSFEGYARYSDQGCAIDFSFAEDARIQSSLIFPRSIVQPAVALKLDVLKMAAPSYPEEVSLLLPSDGNGLSSILAGLYLEDLERFRNLVSRLKEVIPEVQDISLRRVKRGRVGFEILFDMKSGKGIPAFSVSEGTLLTLGLLAALETSGSAQLVLIDDLEQALHPRALGCLIQLLRRTQVQNPELQIVATSHSPYLVDFLQAEEVLLANLDEDGYAVIKPLTAHPDYERSKDFFDPGEFWSTVGEGWVTKRSESSSSR